MVPVSARHASQETTLDVASVRPRPVRRLPRDRPDATERAGRAVAGCDLEACNRTIVARMDSPVTLIPQLAAHIVAAGGKRLRPLLTLACRAAVRLSRQGDAPRRARRLRRVHPHRDAAARRRGGRERAAARAGLGQRGVRQPGIRAGGRLPVRPRLPADGGGRLAGGAGASCRAPRRRSPRARCCSLSPRTTCPPPRRAIWR